MERLAAALRTAGIRAAREEPLSRHCTFRIGGPADLAVFPATTDQLVLALRLCAGADVRVLVVGNGSDLLFADAGVRGAVVFTTAMREITPEPDGFSALAGAKVPHLAVLARDRGLSGLEFACGIPATLGGAVCMNAGAHGGETAQVVAGSECYDRETDRVFRLSPEEHEFGYRVSVFARKPGWVLLKTRLRLTPDDPEQIAARTRKNLLTRRASQPLEYPSAGSAFKRPPGDYAARLIDFCGLKGVRVGDAQISEKHAGFLVNRGNATAADVLTLMDRVRETVLRRTGVALEPEIRYVE